MRWAPLILVICLGCGRVKYDTRTSDSGTADDGGAVADAGLGTCTPPEVDVVLGPDDDIGAIVESSPPGTSFLLEAGEYRMVRIFPKDDMAFYGARDEACNRLAELDGSRLLTFEPMGSFWVAGGQDQEGQRHGDCGPEAPRCTYPEDLFFDDVPLTHVASMADLVPGTGYFDYAADQVWIADDPTGHRVEIGTSRNAFDDDGGAVRVTIVGLVIEKYATPAQMGAIGDQYPPAEWAVVDNEVRLNHGVGIKLGQGGVAVNNWVHDNGHTGITTADEESSVIRNEVARNGWPGHYLDRGGIRVGQGARDVVLDNCVHDNRGPGIYVQACTGTDVRDNVVFDNTGGGIELERVSQAIVTDNRVGLNGGTDDSVWAGDAAIDLYTSDSARITGNVVHVAADRGDGIIILWQDRGPGTSGGDNLVTDNDITFLGNAGWSGVAADFSPADVEVHTTNTFDRNSYHVVDPTIPHFWWEGAGRTLAEAQALGTEATSTQDDVVTPMVWSCP